MVTFFSCTQCSAWTLILFVLDLLLCLVWWTASIAVMLVAPADELPTVVRGGWHAQCLLATIARLCSRYRESENAGNAISMQHLLCLIFHQLAFFPLLVWPISQQAKVRYGTHGCLLH